MSKIETTGIKPSIVIVHVIRKTNITYECLLLRRCSTLKGNWQMVSGTIEKGETTTAAASRELHEETGINSYRLYSADFIETYFDQRHDRIFSAVVFVAFIDNEQEIKLSKDEHDAYQWIDINEAIKYLEFNGQREGIKHIMENFINRNPSKHLFISEA